MQRGDALAVDRASSLDGEAVQPLEVEPLERPPGPGPGVHARWRQQGAVHLQRQPRAAGALERHRRDEEPVPGREQHGGARDDDPARRSPSCHECLANEAGRKLISLIS